jgi:taurine--2-oxoglutarate transaminase
VPKGIPLSTEEIKNLCADDDKYVLKSWSRKPDAPIIVGGEGVYIYDAQGHKVMDFSSQLVNVNIGYANARVVEAIKRQADEMPYVSGIYRSLPVIKLAKKLQEISPEGICKSFFTTGGGAAVESAIKMAKQYTGRSKIVALWESYHGSTLGALSATGVTHIRTAFEPLLPGFVHAPPPYCYRCSFGKQYPDCGIECAEFVEKTIRWEGPQTIAAFIGEPVLANKFIIPPREYWHMVRDICDDYGIVMIFDEVITAFGRTGKMFGSEHFNVVPDMIVAGKGITSGYLPLGAVLVSRKIGDYFDETRMQQGFTYAHHPMSCAAGVAEIDVLLEKNLVENASRVGVHLMARLKELEVRHKCIGDVRGLGLLTGIEMVVDRRTKELLSKQFSKEDITIHVRNKTYEKGLETGSATEFAPGILRLCPPLSITKQEVDLAINIVDDVLFDVDSKIA